MPARRACAAFLVLGATLFASRGGAARESKQYGVSTPAGRDIYRTRTTFSEAKDTRDRDFVIEVAVGSGPEGNLGILLGWINKPVRGLEYYLGFGYEVTPSRHYTGAVRYLFNIDGWRPFIGAGYLYNDAYGLGTYSHNVFAELGYSWVLHRTYHLTLGLGFRRILYVGIRDDSFLHGGDVDQAWLQRETDAISPWVPQAALRFSRAF
jgi:hypothetical protein